MFVSGTINHEGPSLFSEGEGLRLRGERNHGAPEKGVHYCSKTALCYDK